MPQYELMYLLGSHVADDEVLKISQAVLKFAENFGATDVKEAHLGKKKLAYPIKKTRNGHYVVVNFTMDAKNINSFDAKIRTQDTNIIRYIIVNLDEHLARMEKDKAEQAKIVRKGPPAETAPSSKATPQTLRKKETAASALEINAEELEKRIEEVLSEDLTK